jgi:3-hydroxyacyl-CoA dehydrogenase/enoyl-CoA hydratase/3-hydroxybutyryl-CoA epimerase
MTAPKLEQFRIAIKDNGIVHLIFDALGRTMNVFSNAAIGDLGAFAAWFAASDLRGALIRSGKDSGFCAGADLPEIWTATDTIAAGPEYARFNAAYDHFFRLSLAMRALETARKPVAAAVAGLALGGGCELALAAHYRVLVDDPRAALGLPESLVGLLPGAGGTQRLPRLIGLEESLPVLLDGARLSGAAALKAGLVDALAAPGEEIAAAERWLLSSPKTVQPWDRAEWKPLSPAEVGSVVGPLREKTLATTLGHYPAPLAILDCVEFGLPQTMDGAIRSEMAIFSHLVQGREARNMIQTMFLGRTDYERLSRKGLTPDFVGKAVAAARSIIAESDAEALAAAGFAGHGAVAPLRARELPGYWIEENNDPRQARARSALKRIGDAVGAIAAHCSHEERRVADYAIVREAGYPAYLGGPLTYVPAP